MSDLLRRLQDAQTNHDSFCFGWLGEAADRIRELEQEVEYLQTDVGLRDDHIRDYLEDIKRLEQRLSNRDAAWDRAIEVWWNCWTRRSNCKDFRADIREILEADGGEV